MSTSTIFPNPSHTIAPGVVSAPRANIIDIGRFLPQTRTQQGARRASRTRQARAKELSIDRSLLPFELLRRIVLPSIMSSGQHELRIAIAGHATAHHVFGLAVTLCEHFPELSAWNIRIVTENPAEAARPYADRGRFQQLDHRHLPLPMLLKYFECKPGYWQATSRLRALVDFRPQRVFHTPGLFDMVLLNDSLDRLSPRELRNTLLNLHGSLQLHGIVIGSRHHLDAAEDLFTPGAEGLCGFYRPRN